MIVKSQCAVCGCDVDYDVPVHEYHDAKEHAASGNNFCFDCERDEFLDSLEIFRVERSQ